MSSGQLTSITKQGQLWAAREGPTSWLGWGNGHPVLQPYPLSQAHDEHLTTLSFKKDEIKNSSLSRQGWDCHPPMAGIFPLAPFPPGLRPPGDKLLTP